MVEAEEVNFSIDHSVLKSSQIEEGMSTPYFPSKVAVARVALSSLFG